MTPTLAGRLRGLVHRPTTHLLSLAGEWLLRAVPAAPPGPRPTPGTILAVPGWECPATAADRRRARAAARDWMAESLRPGAIGGHPPLLARRLMDGLKLAQLDTAVLADEQAGDPAFRQALLQLLCRQARLLARYPLAHRCAFDRLESLVARAAAGLVLPGCRRLVLPAANRLATDLATQILTDDSYVERAPARQVGAVALLTDLRDAFLAADGAVPDWLGTAIGRLARSLPLTTLGDGATGAFNDGPPVGRQHFTRLYARALGSHPAPPPTGTGHLPAGGLYRLAAGDTVILFDAGHLGADATPGPVHNDLLAFEMTDAATRVIVNAGRSIDGLPTGARRAAAHSVPSLTGREPAEIWGGEGLGRRPREVWGRTHRNADGGIGVQGGHDGYRRDGLLIARQLSLSEDGRVVNGRDRYAAAAHMRGRAAIYFHLGPQITPAQKGQAVIATLPGGRRWRLDSPDAQLALLPPENHHTSAACAVMRRDIAPGRTEIAWTLRRLGD